MTTTALPTATASAIPTPSACFSTTSVGTLTPGYGTCLSINERLKPCQIVQNGDFIFRFDNRGLYFYHSTPDNVVRTIPLHTVIPANATLGFFSQAATWLFGFDNGSGGPPIAATEFGASSPYYTLCVTDRITIPGTYGGVNITLWSSDQNLDFYPVSNGQIMSPTTTVQQWYPTAISTSAFSPSQPLFSVGSSDGSFIIYLGVSVAFFTFFMLLMAFIRLRRIRETRLVDPVVGSRDIPRNADTVDDLLPKYEPMITDGVDVPPPGGFTTWSSDRVGEWVVQCGGGEWAVRAVHENQIDGASIASLSVEHMMRLFENAEGFDPQQGESLRSHLEELKSAAPPNYDTEPQPESGGENIEMREVVVAG